MRVKFVLIAVCALAGSYAHAESLVESSSETRFQLDLKVPEAALKPLLPAGWTLNVAAQGPAKDANLRLVFIDRVTINGPDGKPAGKGSNRLVYLVAPVKDPTGANAQLVVGGSLRTRRTRLARSESISPRAFIPCSGPHQAWGPARSVRAR